MRATVVSILMIALSAPMLAQSPPATEFVTVDVTTVGVGMETGAHVVVLHDRTSDKTMPVWIGTAEAQAIARSLYDIVPPRPMTHDLLNETIRRLGATVVEVRVTDSRNGVYYGAVHLRTSERKSVEVDSRPSDALALALRAGAPIRVARWLIEQAPEIELAPPDSVPEIARAIGLTVAAPTPELRDRFRLPEREGVVVLQTSGNSAESGIQRGDLIVEVNGVVPRTVAEFFRAVRRRNGDGARLRYWRDGREAEVRVPTGGDGPDDTPARVEA